ncbi:uncharacterized protein TNCV_4128711 [Trichonephila clavipes]|nr:uncharacterized protein TNCV_4128711 [Trichonephila clavipes]
METNFLRKYLPDLLEDGTFNISRDTWFQQDGWPAYYARPILEHTGHPVHPIREMDYPERQCLQTTIFMQEGATPHIGAQIKALLSANFGDNRVISRHFPDAWLSPSPDLNPCDFWLWVFLKDRVCRGGIRTLPDLKALIIRHVAEIPRELLHATIENVIMRFQHVIDVNGAHIKYN